MDFGKWKIVTIRNQFCILLDENVHVGRSGNISVKMHADSLIVDGNLSAGTPMFNN